jgi:hypothetical protein
MCLVQLHILIFENSHVLFVLEMQIMESLHSIHELNADRWCRMHLPPYYSFRNTEWISINYGIWDIHSRLSGEFNFGLCRSNLTRTLYEVQIKSQTFSQKERLITDSFTKHTPTLTSYLLFEKSFNFNWTQGNWFLTAQHSSGICSTILQQNVCILTGVFRVSLVSPRKCQDYILH